MPSRCWENNPTEFSIRVVSAIASMFSAEILNFQILNIRLRASMHAPTIPALSFNLAVWALAFVCVFFLVWCVNNCHIIS